MKQDLTAWLAGLRSTRRRWVDANRDNRFDRGIWNATVEKYPDPTHFIFELLQNAEDTGATAVRFRLDDEAIVFEHDGRPFDRPDIEGITGIGNTTKLEDSNKIGSFGIGFKSAYVVTRRPEVHCRIEGVPVAFAIEDLVVPELIPARYDDDRTRIILPLPAATAGATLAKVGAALEASGARSLLFLKNIKRLDWGRGPSVETCAVLDDDAGIRTLRTETDAAPAKSERHIILERKVDRKGDGRSHSVKVALRLNDGGEVVPVVPSTKLAVFFETEEATGLHFHVHGPFKLTDNRANIKREDPWNSQLIDEIACLLADSLPGLRDLGFLTRGFLEILPNGNDDFPEHWRTVREAAVEAFRKHDLLPAHGGGHAPAGRAVRGPADIRDILGDEGLAALDGQAGLRWIVGGMRNSRVDAFLQTLQLREWGHAEFLAAFQKTFSHAWDRREIESKELARAWFDALPDERVQRIYLLVDTAAGIHKRAASLARLPFVRLEDGTRATPSAALLPPTDSQMHEEAASDGLSFVRSALVREGRARGKDVEQFLRGVGVKETDEGHYLENILRANYASGKIGPTAERHLQHMRRFLKWFSETRKHSLFEISSFLRAEGSECYHTPGSVYLDAPFVETGLSKIYGGCVKGRDRRPLWSGYAKLKRAELLALLSAVHVEQAIVVENTRIPYSHPRWSQLFHGFGAARKTSTQTNSDYTISEIEGLLALGDAQVSKMVWKAVAAVGERSMYARQAPNREHEPHQELSTLALALRAAAWIPAKDGSLRRPRAITATELAAGFPTAGNDAWLGEIDFGSDNRRRSQQHLARRSAAQSIGLPAELADRLERLSPEAIESLGSEMLRRIESGAFTRHEFPEREAPNPERRSERIAERAQAAPAKTYEIRSRSVRTSDRETKLLARPYLRDLYTNDAGDMICQACHDVMPFKLSDGSPYFETPEVVTALSGELAENHLALCPTCSAKWQHANETSETDLKQAISTSDKPDIEVTLAGAVVRLRFVRVHFDDLCAILAAPKAAAG